MVNARHGTCRPKGPRSRPSLTQIAKFHARSSNYSSMDGGASRAITSGTTTTSLRGRRRKVASTRTSLTARETSRAALGSSQTTAANPSLLSSLRRFTSPSSSGAERGKKRSSSRPSQIADLVSHLIGRGIAKAKPLAEQWWRETGRPVIDAQREKIRERRSRRKAQKKVAIVEGIVVEPSQELAETSEEARPNMSSAEAQARYLAALAAARTATSS